MDKKNSRELIAFIVLSITLIEERFNSIHQRDDFIEDHGQILLNSERSFLITI